MRGVGLRGRARAGAGGGAAWPGRAGAWSYIWRGRRELEKLRGRGRRRSQWAVSWVSGERSSWGTWVVECVRPWRGWSLPGGSVLASAGWGPSGRPVGGGKRTRTRPHVLEDLTTDVAVIFFWLNRIIEN